MNISVPITLGNQTRTIEFKQSFIPIDGGTLLTAPSVFAARIGNGAKLHRSSAKAILFESPEAANEAAGSADDIIPTDHGVILFRRSTMLRRRAALIVAWADDVANTPWGSKQRYHGRL